MEKLNLITFASALNKQGAIRQAHKQLFDVLDGHYQVQITDPAQAAQLPASEFQLVFVSSGGVEYMFREHYPQLPHPVVLLTDGLQNSLAASLEISTWVRGQGAPCRIIHGSSSAIIEPVQQAWHEWSQRRLLAGKRIGVIGEPSQWLIASGVDSGKARARWGVEFAHISLDEVEQQFHSIADADVLADVDQFLSRATMVREPSRPEAVKAMRLQRAIARVCRQHSLDAFTIQCFGLIPRLGTTGCLALSMLNDEGIVAGCEGDMQTVFTMLVAQALTESPGFMCNPSQIDVETGDILLAHCTVGLKQTSSYVVRSHFESLSGVAIQGEMPAGDYTLVKCGGTGLDEYFVSGARFIENTHSDNVCRTQVRLHLDQPCSYFFNNPIANHHVLLHGDHARQLAAFFELNGMTRRS